MPDGHRDFPRNHMVIVTNLIRALKRRGGPARDRWIPPRDRRREGGGKSVAETVRKCSCRMEKRADLFRPKSSNSPGPQQPVAGLLPVKGSFPVKGRSGGLEDMLGNDGARLNRAISFVPHDGEVAISLPHALG